MARVSSCFSWDESREHLDVALSESDLITLLTLLYTPGSAKSIVSRDVPVEFVCSRIRVEPDEHHYAHPGRDGVAPAAVNPLDAAAERTMQAVIEQHMQRAGAGPRLEWVEEDDH